MLNLLADSFAAVKQTSALEIFLKTTLLSSRYRRFKIAAISANTDFRLPLTKLLLPVLLNILLPSPPDGGRHTTKAVGEFHPLSIYYSRCAIGKSEKHRSHLLVPDLEKMTASEFSKWPPFPIKHTRTTKVSKLQSFINVHLFDVRAPCASSKNLRLIQWNLNLTNLNITKSSV